MTLSSGADARLGVNDSSFCHVVPVRGIWLSRVDCSGTDRRGTDRNGTERRGTERNGTERSGTDRSGALATASVATADRSYAGIAASLTSLAPGPVWRTLHDTSQVLPVFTDRLEMVSGSVNVPQRRENPSSRSPVRALIPMANCPVGQPIAYGDPPVCNGWIATGAASAAAGVRAPSVSVAHWFCRASM